MYKWIIIGGGIQGTTVAAYLLATNTASQQELVIIDPHDRPIQNWKNCTKKIAMPFLRSPFVHHLDPSPFSLEKFAKNTEDRYRDTFLGPYKRPSLEVFNKHCDELISIYGIDQCWLKGTVTSLQLINRTWDVQVNGNTSIKGDKVILALGLSEQPKLPTWASDLKLQRNEQVFHIFDQSLESLHNLKPPITIIGGGITAVHTALHLSSIFPGDVTLLTRHSFRVHDFDSNPGWLGPKYMERFKETKDYSIRREMIRNARNKGSITRDLFVKVKRAIRTGSLKFEIAEIQDVRYDKSDDHIAIRHSEQDHSQLYTQSIVLATGFENDMPGKAWIDPFIQEHNLKCSKCGYPIVSHHLEWMDNLYVAGALAELEIGPTARNISGARKAAEAIVTGV
ncbi:thioredoxin reductase [Bacillus mesophilus]|uniref:Lysine N(6)-hydroxylase/L-ornithine N(5)-oxygenase family protein n=1 Tax=Bacillus mesophilus TaxID=1808955 RepID=A0A6M0Q335_9BACI|nr:FAD/NAD(P)-binding protein [Bacillus mesophilus]MBM7659898.1 thioredoxin reductase [Bacillus mesophilus]NEY70757.1 lysine N(6)-hydroxylase/L-ornithine N(5)-oxygenase family protein [Bacillus mesophilus]